MSAAATDYFLKVRQNFSTVIGSGGVGSAVVTTIPLSSVTNLPTDTAIELVINRVDSSGEDTNNYETVRGVISGSNLTDAVRGVEGTAQAWDAGVVVEYLVTADIQNRMVDGLLVEHGQDGIHSTATFEKLAANQTITGVKTYSQSAIFNSGFVSNSAVINSAIINQYIGGSAIDTDGTLAANSDSKVATQKAVKTYADTKIANPMTTQGDVIYGGASGVPTRLAKGTAAQVLAMNAGATAPEWVAAAAGSGDMLYADARFKVAAFTYDLTTASGTQAITGVGFAPKAVIFLAVKDQSTVITIGFDNYAAREMIGHYGATNWTVSAAASIYADDGAGNSQRASITTLGADGFTLTWVKAGSPTGTLTVYYLALR